MAKVLLSFIGGHSVPLGQPSPDEVVSSGVQTRTIFDENRGVTPLRHHVMPEGSVITWRPGVTGRLIYVWSGCMTLSGETLDADSTIIIEPDAGSTVTADLGGCEILVFDWPAGISDNARSAGGNVHVLPSDKVPRVRDMHGDGNFGAAMYANSSCPTCCVWMHSNIYHQEDYEVAPHYHSEDEIIVVTQGEACLGHRRLERGAAISIAANTIYSFRTGNGGLSYINFRRGHPRYGIAGQSDTVDERTYYTQLGTPPYHPPGVTPFSPIR